MDTLLYWLAMGLVKSIQALPLRLVAAIGRGGGALAYWLDARHRRIARQNLAAAFPEKSPRQIGVLACENFKRLGENYCCAVKTAVMSREQLSKHLEIVGAEKVSPNTEQGISHIFAIGHFGNFELYARANFVVPHYQFATTYRALKQPGLNRVLFDLRSRSGCLLFERRTESYAIKTALKAQRLMLGFLSDQHAGRSGAWIPMFGRLCSTTTAPAIFAMRYKLPLHTAICYRTASARWRIEIGDEISTSIEGKRRPVPDVMLDVNRAFEAAIRWDPANWFWVHRRWKTPPTNLAPAEPAQVPNEALQQG